MRSPIYNEALYYVLGTGEDHFPRCWIQKAPWMFFGRWTGFTFAWIIFVKEDRLDVVVHEMVHVRQFNKGYGIGFWVKYLYYLARYGYSKNPYEREAYLVQEWVQERLFNQIKV